MSISSECHSDIPSPSIPPEFYSRMIIVHSVAYYVTFFYVHFVGMTFRHPISVHSAGILFRYDHCPFGSILRHIFLCPLRRMLSDIPSPSIPPEFYSGMIIVHSVAHYSTSFYVHCVGCYPTSHLRPFPAILCGFVLCCSCYLPFIASMRRIFMCGIYFFHFRAPKFAYIKNFAYLCTRFQR